MRLTIACVGRVGDAPEQALCETYCTRAGAIGRKLGFSGPDLVAVDISRAATAAMRLEDEARRLAAKLPAGTRLIVLDESGRSLASEDFARHLARLRDQGLETAGFVIGGPDGLSPHLMAAAAERLAFGRQTWPHLLVRAMLAEQIYRAFTILSGHPYHRRTRP